MSVAQFICCLVLIAVAAIDAFQSQSMWLRPASRATALQPLRATDFSGDPICLICPYFEVQPEKLDDFKKLWADACPQVAEEPKCLFWGFDYNGNIAFCREGYEDADGVLAHLDNVGGKLDEALTMATLQRLEIHGPAAELEKLKEPLKDFNVEYFVAGAGFRK